MSSHFDRATGSEMRAFFKSAGTLCTAPRGIAFLAMDFILHRYPISLGVLGPRGEVLVNRVTGQMSFSSKLVNRKLGVDWDRRSLVFTEFL